MDFLTDFHMVWKNQKGWQSSLVGFWVSRRSKISVNFFFFFAFSSCHYGFINCFEILNFVFSNIPKGVSICEY